MTLATTTPDSLADEAGREAAALEAIAGDAFADPAVQVAARGWRALTLALLAIRADIAAAGGAVAGLDATLGILTGAVVPDDGTPAEVPA